MKTLLIALAALTTVVCSRPALAQRCVAFQPPVYYSGGPYTVPAPFPPYGFPPYPYYPFPLPPAPSFGFGHGGIYNHYFVGRDESITSYTFPGVDNR